MSHKNQRRLAGLTLGITLCLAAFTGPSETGRSGIGLSDTELFENGGFESKLDGWRALDLSKTCQFEIDKKVKKNGKLSLRIERGDGSRPDFLKQFVDLPDNGGTVEFEAYLRVDKPGNVRVTLLLSDAQSSALSNTEIATEGPTKNKWKKVSGTADVPAGTKTVGVNFWFREEGVVWIDEVSLKWAGPKKKAKKAKFEVLNGSFDHGLDDWQPFDLKRASVVGKVDQRVGKGSLRLERESQRLFPVGGKRHALPVRATTSA
ncbi:MAG: hypothetical protein ACI8X5_003256 [Planctomycetota bacterium]|jgi:hypothetical protein